MQTIGSFSAISKKNDYTLCQNIILNVAQMKTMSHKPVVEIEYCTQCGWLLRAAWLAQELLTTFVDDLASVNLIPSTGGILEVRLNGLCVFSRKSAGRFPEAKELKQLIRDQIDPERSLGHSDTPVNAKP